jgi:hypothetical protein
MSTPIDLQPSVHKFNETWEVKRMRLDAEWKPLVDDKNRKVHGWAHIEEIPANMLGRVLVQGSSQTTISSKPLGVQLIATRDGRGFGAIARTTWYSTYEDALAGARKALVQQGKRYAKKYGTSSERRTP